MPIAETIRSCCDRSMSWVNSMNNENTINSKRTYAPVTHWNKTYRHALRLGLMLEISILVAFLLPADSHFLNGVVIGYAVGCLFGCLIIRYAAHRMRRDIFGPAPTRQEAA